MPLPRYPHISLSGIARSLKNVHLASALETKLDVADGDGLDEEVGEALPSSKIAADFRVGLAYPGEEE
jgi:hypothetical protein